MERWRNAVKNAKVNLFVEVYAIYINKANIPVSVKLTADGRDTKTYEYSNFDSDYLAYEVSKHN